MNPHGAGGPNEGCGLVTGARHGGRSAFASHVPRGHRVSAPPSTRGASRERWTGHAHGGPTGLQGSRPRLGFLPTTGALHTLPSPLREANVGACLLTSSSTCTSTSFEAEPQRRHVHIFKFKLNFTPNEFRKCAAPTSIAAILAELDKALL